MCPHVTCRAIIHRLAMFATLKQAKMAWLKKMLVQSHSLGAKFLMGWSYSIEEGDERPFLWNLIFHCSKFLTALRSVRESVQVLRNVQCLREIKNVLRPCEYLLRYFNICLPGLISSECVQFVHCITLVMHYIHGFSMFCFHQYSCPTAKPVLCNLQVDYMNILGVTQNLNYFSGTVATRQYVPKFYSCVSSEFNHLEPVVSQKASAACSGTTPALPFCSYDEAEVKHDLQNKI